MPTDLSPASPLPTYTPDIFDPAGLGPIPGVPLIPEVIRRKHHVFVEADTRFRQAARFLQNLWRVDRGLPIGAYTDGNGKMRKLGSRISAKAGEAGANFIDPAILPVVNRALVYRELGAVFELDRLKTNLLASQTLVFSAFSPLARDLALAGQFIAELLPGIMEEVTHVLFETSPPGRGNPIATFDGTAFDLAFVGRSTTGRIIFVAFELKYSETGQEPLPRFSGRFDEIAPTSSLFIEPSNPVLKANPVQQSFRQLCLAATMLDQGLADNVLLVFVAPAHNHLAQASAQAARRHLLDPDQGRVPFIPITLERVFAALAAIGLPDHARALHRRYTDFWLIDGELQLDPPPAGPAQTKRTPAPARTSEDPSPSTSGQSRAQPSRRSPTSQRTKRAA